MTRSSILKVTSFFLLLPFVNIHFNNLVRPCSTSASGTLSTFNICASHKTHSHQACFNSLNTSETTVLDAPDFGQEMGKYIKDNFVNEDDYRIKTVVIDAGHGGRDGGASGKFLVEKDIALNIALRLGGSLSGNFPNLRVIYTRDTDVFIPLNQRANIANDNNADLFISIHCNFMPDGGRINGSETYVMGLHTAEQNLRVAKRENASILYEQNYQNRYDGYDPNSPEGHIILSMYQHAYLEQSILLADKIEQHASSGTRRKSRGVKQAGFVVLKQTTMPSVLVETGYLSNEVDESYLATESGQSNIALSILQAFMDYKKEVEANNGKKYANLEQLQLSSTHIQVDPNSRSVTPKAPSKPTPVTPTHGATTYQPVSKGMAPALMVKDQSEETLTKKEIEATDYKVLLASSPTLLDTSKKPWGEVQYSVQVLKEDNLFKYFVIGFKKKEKALKVKEEMRNMGFSEAFIIAYRNGQRINESLRVP